MSLTSSERRRPSALGLAGLASLLIASGAHAADLRTYPVERFGYRATHIVLEGDIVPGDAARLAEIIAAATVASDIELYSRGGDLTESLVLAQLVQANGITAWTAVGIGDANTCTNAYGALSGARDPSNCLCGSACAIVWMAAPSRVGTEVFVHRFWYPPGALAEMSQAYVAAMYERQTRIVRVAMDALGIPRAIFDAMMAVPSAEPRRLSASELTVTLRPSPRLTTRQDTMCGALPDDVLRAFGDLAALETPSNAQRQTRERLGTLVAHNLDCAGRVTLSLQAEAQHKTLTPRG